MYNLEAQLYQQIGQLKVEFRTLEQGSIRICSRGCSLKDVVYLKEYKT
jgi:hypothetical protein